MSVNCSPIAPYTLHRLPHSIVTPSPTSATTANSPSPAQLHHMGVGNSELWGSPYKCQATKLVASVWGRTTKAVRLRWRTVCSGEQNCLHLEQNLGRGDSEGGELWGGSWGISGVNQIRAEIN